ncbi:MAG: hypothetical protein MJZ37_09125 [Bacilli bacterium]|nr:hypothetical protein [Bacilli bacterium]
MTKKVSIFEIVWYSICGASAITGLVFCILGLVGQFGGSSVVSLRDFSTPGYICLIAGAVAAVIVLLIYAKGNDRANEAAARRAARLAKVEATSEAPKAE